MRMRQADYLYWLGYQAFKASDPDTDWSTFDLACEALGLAVPSRPTDEWWADFYAKQYDAAMLDRRLRERLADMA